jgi:type II secretory pathway predicted ATPase ExeA/phage tail protein X
MYVDFYGLKEKPFNLTPSPRFLYLGEEHKEALALLSYGVTERRGFILLTGEVGTGKTTMIHALLNSLDKNIEYVYISNPLMSPKDFMNYLAFSVFKKKVHFKSKADFLIEFEYFLKNCLQHQIIFILIIDEAQSLSFELLEEIRLLSNMESADDKLINIFLVGQPELNEKLNDARCRPLQQRISIRYHIPPLDQNSTSEYIRIRLKVAGAQKENDIFPQKSIETIHNLSKGYPRMINVLADNALLYGYAKGKKRISPSMITQCRKDMDLNGSFSETFMDGPDTPKRERLKPIRYERYWKWIMVPVLLVLIMLGILSYHYSNMISELTDTVNILEQIKTPDEKDVQPIVKKEIHNELPTAIDTDKIENSSSLPSIANEEGKDSIRDEKQVEPYKIAKVIPEKDKVHFRSVIVKEGDTLARLAAAIYHRVDADILTLIKENNPSIEDPNRITTGQEIQFPDLSALEDAPIYTVHVASYKPFESARNLFQDYIEDGYEAYILPISDPKLGKLYRVAIGHFQSRKEAENYASELLGKGVTDYAEAILLDLKQ